MEPPTDPARHAQEEFARDVVRLLDQKRESGSFERLSSWRRRSFSAICAR